MEQPILQILSTLLPFYENDSETQENLKKMFSSSETRVIYRGPRYVFKKKNCSGEGFGYYKTPATFYSSFNLMTGCPGALGPGEVNYPMELTYVYELKIEIPEFCDFCVGNENFSQFQEKFYSNRIHFSFFKENIVLLFEDSQILRNFPCPDLSNYANSDNPLSYMAHMASSIYNILYEWDLKKKPFSFILRCFENLNIEPDYPELASIQTAYLPCLDFNPLLNKYSTALHRVIEKNPGNFNDSLLKNKNMNYVPSNFVRISEDLIDERMTEINNLFI